LFVLSDVLFLKPFQAASSIIGSFPFSLNWSRRRQSTATSASTRSTACCARPTAPSFSLSEQNSWSSARSLSSTSAIN